MEQKIQKLIELLKTSDFTDNFSLYITGVNLLYIYRLNKFDSVSALELLVDTHTSFVEGLPRIDELGYILMKEAEWDKIIYKAGTNTLSMIEKKFLKHFDDLSLEYNSTRIPEYSNHMFDLMKN